MRTSKHISKKKADIGTKRQRSKRIPGNYLNFLMEKKRRENDLKIRKK